MAHSIVWFDLPVRNLETARAFYSAVLDLEVREEFPGVAVLSHKDGEVSGCLFSDETAQASVSGPLLYFNVDGRLSDALTQARERGAKVIQDIHEIGPFGQRAIILDCEGNRIALHSAS